VIAGRLKVAFLADYNVSLAEVNHSRRRSLRADFTAGMEASGTGNMKLALNGALTIGTLDGANIEIRDHVGAENIAIFRHGGRRRHDPAQAGPGCERCDPPLAAAGAGDPRDRERRVRARRCRPVRFDRAYAAFYRPLHGLRDFDSYYEAQRSIDARWQVVPAWTRASILNVARMPWFSSDRTIREYAAEIWNVPVQAAAAALQEPGAQRGAKG